MDEERKEMNQKNHGNRLTHSPSLSIVTVTIYMLPVLGSVYWSELEEDRGVGFGLSDFPIS
mgnify:CR=1 FL=1